MDEILNLVCREIVKSGYEERLAAGIVLTGGTALLEGVAELAERIFNMPVRRGTPLGIGGLTEVVKSPLYATGVGLLFYGSRLQAGGGSAYRKSEGNLFGRMIRKISRWSKELF
jgi:cell division protein FtsA